MAQPSQAPPQSQPRPENPTAQVLFEVGGPALLALATAHRARQQMLSLLAVRHLRTLWRHVDPADPQGSWARVARRALVAMVAAQAQAARGSSEYVAAALGHQGAASDPVGELALGAFSGAAADGRPLDSLLGYPAFEATALADRGMDRAQAVAVAGRHLDRIVGTEIADAARTATGVAIVNDRKAAGWMRMLTPPSCSRCVILAGVVYRSEAGAAFRRHPGCDCIAVPTVEMVDPPSPLDIFHSMTDDGLKRAGWSKADIAAIRDHGADIFQVTNAHRELYTATIAGQQLAATRHGTTRRGLAGQRLGKRGIRLTPTSLYAEAQRLGWSRDELVAQLMRHGYIV